MLLVVGSAGHARNNSKYGAQAVVCAIDRVGHPAAAASVPALTLENFVQSSARADWWRHRAQRASVSFFLKCAVAQKFLHLVLAGKCALRLIMEFSFLPFFGRLHSANRDIGSGNVVPPVIQTARNGVFIN